MRLYLLLISILAMVVFSDATKAHASDLHRALVKMQRLKSMQAALLGIGQREYGRSENEIIKDLLQAIDLSPIRYNDASELHAWISTRQQNAKKSIELQQGLLFLQRVVGYVALYESHNPTVLALEQALDDLVDDFLSEDEDEGLAGFVEDLLETRSLERVSVESIVGVRSGSATFKSRLAAAHESGQLTESFRRLLLNRFLNLHTNNAPLAKKAKTQTWVNSPIGRMRIRRRRHFESPDYILRDGDPDLDELRTVIGDLSEIAFERRIEGQQPTGFDRTRRYHLVLFDETGSMSHGKRTPVRDLLLHGLLDVFFSKAGKRGDLAKAWIHSYSDRINQTWTAISLDQVVDVVHSLERHRSDGGSTDHTRSLIQALNRLSESEEMPTHLNITMISDGEGGLKLNEIRHHLKPYVNSTRFVFTFINLEEGHASYSQLAQQFEKADIGAHEEDVRSHFLSSQLTHRVVQDDWVKEQITATSKGLSKNWSAPDHLFAPLYRALSELDFEIHSDPVGTPQEKELDWFADEEADDPEPFEMDSGQPNEDVDFADSEDDLSAETEDKSIDKDGGKNTADTASVGGESEGEENQDQPGSESDSNEDADVDNESAATNSQQGDDDSEQEPFFRIRRVGGVASSFYARPLRSNFHPQSFTPVGFSPIESELVVGLNGIKSTGGYHLELETAKPTRLKKQIVPLFKPKGYRLVGIEVWDENQRLIRGYDVYQLMRSGMYYAHFKRGPEEGTRLFHRARYIFDPEKEELPKAFEQMSSHCVFRMAAELHAMGAVRLARAIYAYQKQNQKVSAEDIVRLFKEFAYYTYAKEARGQAPDQENSFAYFCRFLRGEDLFYQCDGSNKLFARFLTRYLQDTRHYGSPANGLHVENLQGFALRPEETEALGGHRHLITNVSYLQGSRKVRAEANTVQRRWLDATPNTMDPEHVKTSEGPMQDVADGQEGEAGPLGSSGVPPLDIRDLEDIPGQEPGDPADIQTPFSPQFSWLGYRWREVVRRTNSFCDRLLLRR